MDTKDWLRSACGAFVAGYAADAAAAAADLPESSSSALQQIGKIASSQEDADYTRLASALSDTLQDRIMTLSTAQHFWSLIPDIMARWIGVTHISEAVWEARLDAVAAICGSFPHLWPIANAFLSSSPFLTSPLSQIPAPDLISRPPTQLCRLLLAYHRLLAADPALPSRHTWPHEPLHILASQHPDSGVRLLAVQVLCRQLGWSEAKRLQLERDYVGDIRSVDVPMIVGAEVRDGKVQDVVIDGWLLGVQEAKRIEQLHVNVAGTAPIDLIPLQPYLCPRIALIGKALFLRSSPSLPIPFVHVPTQATTDALASLIPFLQTGSPVLLSSLPSSGKTHLLHHLSTVLYPSVEPTNRILSIPLADTTIDVKSLIGTYVSSPTKPGTFEWMEGALAKAVRAGRWVVLDDIDRAGMEMLVTVAQLARSLKPGRAGRRGRLQVPGRPDIEAGEGFALFATRSTKADAHTPPAFFGHHNFTEVTLAPPSEDDILSILSAQFGRVPTSVIATLVRVWQELRPLARVPGPVKPREVGLRDLEKWCARVQRNLPIQATIDALESNGNPLGLFANPVFQDEVLLEAVDVFMASFDSKPTSLERKAGMIAVVAEAMGMDEERAMALIEKRRPTLDVSTGTRQLLIGRTVTPLASSERKSKSKASSEDEKRPFALTKPSLVLLERVAASTALAEPTLLVGETGTGKTTAVQYIANAAGKPLTVLNLSMQTESSDLLGGFKPIDASASARLLHTKWQKLFIDTFSMAKPANGTYLEIAAKVLAGRKWARCAELWSSSAKKALDKLVKKDEAEEGAMAVDGEDGSGTPRKKRKTNMRAAKAAVAWQALMVEIADFDLHHVKGNSKLVFSFVEGPLVKAIQAGEWILLDEVNLASQETLEAIATILESPSASLVLTERGDVEPIKRHAEFRLFACMNPATDVGKKDLPPSLRTRFTELYVPPPDDDREALVSIVTGYIGDVAAGDRAAILDVAEMYLTLKRLSADKEIVDGANAAPHFSMRTLARALSFAVETAPLFGLRRGLWEGCLMAFTMSLDAASIERAKEVCQKFLLGPLKNAKAVLSQIPQLPTNADADDFVRFGAFWLKRGPLPPVGESRYVITPSVQSKLSDLARVILTHRYPVLIQGPTSAGKTSAVEFLARQTGHRFVRINNHEHTDIQEYLGTYVTDPKTGSLVFQEGLLVTAVRQGHWIVLDELNLAPTDVLEALNRLLDDNRELVIPETQEVIKPHPNFILFATQNPPGLYAGRKVLSRAFRNRFLEVHFDDVPKNELETILCQRCQIAPSYAKKIVQVFEELRHRRQASRVFESKSSFATLRDLFRWAERGAVGYQQLAEDGYMLLAERGRNEEDKEVIKGVIEDVMKVKVDQSKMYDLFSGTESTVAAIPPDAAGPLARLPFDAVPTSMLVWTKAMQRLFTLVASALAHKEPVLLVGETGCGKTSVCDIVAAAFRQQLVGVNCHQNMETADLLGSQRPVRNRLERKGKIIARLNAITPIPSTATDDELATVVSSLIKQGHHDIHELQTIAQDLAQLNALFEWSDGPLVHAMYAGDLLLLDEVSLADDSVLERLNSVLEPGRTLVLAEKGGSDIDSATIVAADNFHVVATMNPGGDFGKKELSPALRNRFTEIWVPALTDRADLLQIIGLSWKVKGMEMYGGLMLDFMWWFCDRVGDAAALGLRDILAWVDFMNRIVVQEKLSPAYAFHHGGQMVVVDGLESLPQTSGLSSDSISELRRACLDHLTTLTSASGQAASLPSIEILANETHISIGGFAVHRGPIPSDAVDFRFNAPTTAVNAMRVLRGCQLPKAILLEGSPGVGKTSLVNALASISGHRLQRINLSDQTDLIDLFGSDLPVEGGQPGEFQWRDAAFLDAMQKGDWVLLDEMNLASQTVLEGLNAVLDHRGTVYIPELGRSFDRHSDFRVFAAQNPLQQGGGRKGLPKSFLNRFTKVYLSEHTAQDLLLICQELHPLPTEMVEKMIRFNEEIRVKTMITRTIGREGSPWEFNLRDLFRWFGLLSRRNGLEASLDPVEFLRMVYLDRFRNVADRQAVQAIFEEVFDTTVSLIRPAPFFGPSDVQIGHSTLTRGSSTTVTAPLQHAHLDVAESVLKAVEMGWLVILAGDSGAGKRHLLQGIAQRAGRDLGEFAMHPGVDTSEILGSFEQQDLGRLAQAVNDAMVAVIREAVIGQPQLALAATDALQTAFVEVSANPEDGVSIFCSTCTDILSRLSSISTSAHKALAEAALAKLRDSSALSGFAWIDGQLVKSLRDGGWFLISEANLCSASVLDRLNSLCENNGSLVLSEKGSATGQPEMIKPHEGFRLFMTYDPRYGELSRAMRNRGIELHVARPEAVKVAQSSSVAIDSSSDVAALALTTGGLTPSRRADGLASTLRSALPLLTRVIAGDPSHSSTGRALQLAESALSAQSEQIGTQHFGTQTLDAAIHLTADRFDAVFRMLQLYLRLEEQHESSKLFLQDTDNARTVLARSATATLAGRRKDFPGKQIQPFLTGMREALVSALASMLGEEGVVIADGLDGLATLINMVESHARSVVFDYSATNLLSVWIREALDEMPSLSPAASLVNALGEAMQLTSGHAQTEVWNAFREVGRPVGLDEQAMDKINSVKDLPLRRSLLEALVSVKTQASEDDIAQLQALIANISQDAMPTGFHPIDERWRSTGLYNMLKLRQVANPESDSSALLLHQAAVSVDSLADLQLLSSSYPANTPALTFKVITAWLMDTWAALSGDDKALSGPADLLGPAQLRNALRFESNDMIRLHDLPALDGALRFTVDSVLAGTAQEASRNDEFLQVALTAMGALFTSCTSLPGPIRDLTQLRQSLDALPDGAVAMAARKHLAAPLQTASAESSTSTVGDVYLGASAFLIELYITNFPIDPSVRRILEGELLDARSSELTEELQAVEAGEIRLKGISDSHRRARILARIEDNSTAKTQLGPLLQRESDPTRLAQLFSEVHAFLGDIMSESSISAIRDALRKSHLQAMARESSLQAAAEAFIMRMSTIYADMDDLVRPIILAVLFTRLGMRCLARDMELRQHLPNASIDAALSFPLARTAQRLSVATSNGTINSRQALLSAMSTVACMLGADQQAALAPVLHAQLDGLYQLWSDARTKEQQDEQAKESLYRVKKTDIEVESDIELEERELAEMFPSYENLDEIRANVKEEGAVIDRFTNDDVAAFHVLVQAAASQSPDKVVPSLRQALRDLVKTDFDHRAYGDELDRSSIAYQIDVLHRRLTATKAQSSPPNFYLDANEPEIRKAHELVSALHRRLTILIDDWPEQMVLQHIRERADKFLALDIRSPVALVLAALEQLLQHTDDWEPYASKDNSLRVFRADASTQIINWRRLELSSWNRLLDDQASQYVAKDDEWTVRLYGSFISAATTTDDIAKHIDTILPMLSTFLQHSTMGHFVSRLEVLDNLAKIARHASKDQSPAAANLDAVSTVLSNIIANTRLIAPKIESHIHAQRTAIDKAIKDFIKLASWKDINVHALRASAQKSHRQLHKNIRKFRELLSSPVAPFLGDVSFAIGQETPQTTTCLRAPIFNLEAPTFPVRQDATDATRPAHLVNLADTFTRFARLHSAATDDLPVKVGEDIDGMAVDIIETAAELAKATPSTLTKENAKVVNNLASRKRKAFADMLKALRSSGFSNNVRADAMARQQSTTWLAQRPILDVDTLPDGFAKSDVRGVIRYHTKLGALMVALRAAFNGHNPDIASQDLQRGIGFAESIYACALTERDRLHGIINTVSALTSKLARLEVCMSDEQLFCGTGISRAFAEAAFSCATLASALQEIDKAVGKHSELAGKPADVANLAIIREYAAELQSVQGNLEGVTLSVSKSCYDVFGEGETAILTRYGDVRARLISYLEHQCDTQAGLRYLYQPVLQLARNSTSGDLHAATNSDDFASQAQADEMIQSLLVITQSLARAETKDEEEPERPHIPRAFAAQRSALNSMHIENILQRLDAFIGGVIANNSGNAQHALARVLPFLQRLSETYAQSASVHIYTTKSTYKLCYVVGRIMLDLAQKGFCKPEEESDSKDDGDGDGQMTDGTGMGAGSGDKNVSNEIEEEGQVEGLQGEKEEDGEREEKEGDDDAFEMENDFEGDLEDGKEAEEGEGEEDGEEEERDDHAGDVDPLDPGAVDEKFWGDEEEQEGKDGGDEVMDQQTQEAGGESEMTAKDDQQKQDGKKDPKEKQQDQEMGESAQDDADGPEDKFEEQDDGEEQDAPAEEDADNEDQAGPDQPNVNVPEGDKLDLPEDINLDGEESGSEMDAEDDIDLPVDEHDDDDRNNDQGDDIDMASQDDGVQAEDAPAPTGVGEEETSEQEEAMAQNLDLSASNDAQAQEAAEKGQGAGGQSEQQLEKEDAEQEDNEPDVQKAEHAEEAEPQGQGAAQGPSTGPTGQNQGDGTIDSSGAPIPNDPSLAPQQNRSLGDIMQEIRRRQDEILAQQERDNEVDKRDDAQAEASGQVEYLHDNDEDQGQQALGAAGEEDRQRLEELDIVDEDEDVEGDRGFEDDMDLDEQTSTEKGARPDQSHRPEQPADTRPAEKALTQSDVMGGREAPVSTDQMDLDAEEGETELKTEIKEEIKEGDVDLTIVDQPTISDSVVNADEQWRYYAGLTSDLSYALCEQLRLILEPTLATRLQGDFRTGKRLNMRKIIPYIASEYTKDKIWLRRTKPSRREYQVLLSLDDSRSMSESHSVDLAYQTLALVSQALNKLEVGQIGIAKFGEGVDILHPFGDAGFTDADGAKVMSSFKFDQQKTDVAALVERTLSFLAESRQKQSSTSAPDLWQLQIIISDGVCQDHHRLRTLLRRALEERVMIVFLVIDSLRQSDAGPAKPAAASNGQYRPSILSMQTVEYKNVNGEMQLEMTRYLDTFPFEYYVVLRDVEALPGVLSDTLRQWMARVSQSQE